MQLRRASGKVAANEAPLRALEESMRMVAMYRGSCLFQPSRSSGVFGSLLS